jgi:osmotically-inducible protein OsmY
MMRYLFVLFLASFILTLQGCVPVVATGVGLGASSASADRRTAGTIIDDEGIESKAAQRIKEKHPDVHVNITSFNHFVLVTGEVVNEDAKVSIQRIVGSIPGVKGIANELMVGAVSSLSNRSNDGLITSDVKMRFINNKVFKTDHIKVVTERGVVFLLGLVTHAEADAASEITSTTRSVQKVVRVFEYMD